MSFQLKVPATAILKYEKTLDGDDYMENSTRSENNNSKPIFLLQLTFPYSIQAVKLGNNMLVIAYMLKLITACLLFSCVL